MERVLEIIVRDEARHAALAWCTLEWLLQFEPAAGQSVMHAFASAVKEEEEKQQQQQKYIPSFTYLFTCWHFLPCTLIHHTF